MGNVWEWVGGGTKEKRILRGGESVLQTRDGGRGGVIARRGVGYQTGLFFLALPPAAIQPPVTPVRASHHPSCPATRPPPAACRPSARVPIYPRTVPLKLPLFYLARVARCGPGGVGRGVSGSFVDTLDGSANHLLRVSTRMENSADSGSHNTGFRCVRQPKLCVWTMSCTWFSAHKPPRTHRALCSAQCPWRSNADWCLQSDVVPDSILLTRALIHIIRPATSSRRRRRRRVAGGATSEPTRTHRHHHPVPTTNRPRASPGWRGCEPEWSGLSRRPTDRQNGRGPQRPGAGQGGAGTRGCVPCDWLRCLESGRRCGWEE